MLEFLLFIFGFISLVFSLIISKDIFSFISFNIYKIFILNLYQNNNPNKVLDFAYLNILSFMIFGKLLYSEFMNITFDLIF